MPPSLKDLLALRSLIGEFAAKGRGNETFERLSGIGSMARQELDRAGGIGGLAAMVSELTGSDERPRSKPAAKPRPVAPTLTGVALCGGQGKGSARIAGDDGPPAGLASGDVLVCDVASGEWRSWLDRIGALVVETGSNSSLAVRAARERGVPVVRVRDARALIPDGAEVTVDGRAGTVSLGRVPATPA